MLFFFFQAEDGIRDGRVTGVQTCALPIWAVALYDGIAIARQHRAVFTAPAPGTTGGASLFDEASKALNVGAGNRFATEHELEAVELRRIVRAGQDRKSVV